MRILVTPERLADLAGQFLRVSGELIGIADHCQGIIASLDWEARQKAGVEGQVRTAVRQGHALAEQAEALARFLRDAAERFAEADGYVLPQMGWIMIGFPPSPIRVPIWGRMINFVPPRIDVVRIILIPGEVIIGVGSVLRWLVPPPSDWAERVWNWLHGRGWKTNAELTPPSSKGKLYEAVMRGFERHERQPTSPEKPQQTAIPEPQKAPPPPGDAPLTAARDAAHPLRPADPEWYHPSTGCVQYAINRRPDLRVTDAPIPGAADYIPYYDSKGQVLRLQGTEADLRQVVKPGHAVVWPRGHSDLAGTPGATYGHVAIVEEVYPDRIVVSQAGWPGKPRMEIKREDLASLNVIL